MMAVQYTYNDYNSCYDMTVFNGEGLNRQNLLWTVRL